MANFNVEECLIEQIKNYICTTNWNFAQLKELVLEKKSITELLIRVDDRLSKAETADLEKIKHNLEAESYKKQCSEDEHDKKSELLKKAKDEQLKVRYNQELKKIASSIKQQLEEQQELIQKMNQTALSQITIGRYSSYQQTNQWQYAIQQYEMKIHFLSEKRKIIHDKLQKIEERANLYKLQEQVRNQRKQAGVAYQHSQQNIEQCLSDKNRELFHKNCVIHSQSLKKKKAQLNSIAERMHFSLFLQQLAEELPLMPLNIHEKTAMQAILKLRQKHSEHTSDLILFQASLAKKKNLISTLLVQLHGLKDKVRLLIKQSPSISNEELTKKIKTLYDSLAKNRPIQKRLNAFSLLSLGLSCILSIPLILALNGSFSFFTPVVLYCLVAIPPALCLLCTLGLAIASLVYFFKIKEATDAIKNNKLDISSNLKQESNKEVDLKELELISIPTLEKQISKEEHLRDDLLKTVEKTQKQLNDCLVQAQGIVPSSRERLSLFDKNHNAPEPDFDISTLLTP
ncbi:hypothetical protein [Legionella sp. km772]|uniref:hypothetical protein n=1 Tax=Legionella sp. km772 TaxID=2498111 RepID=UPI000F8DF3E5|nr:hypothetical protein [Legionella sp. km772]RUR10399.1 hypothetical protein ELY15_08165 [Legionella sp. km772]